MSIVLKREATVAIPTPAVGKETLFFDLSDGLLYKKDSSGVVTLIEAGSSPVTSVFGRVGVVTAQANDYTAAQIQNFDTTVDGRITLQKGVANGIATLDAGGKVPLSELPDISITDVFVVASQAAMLALPAQVGDVAIRTDQSLTYILRVSPATVLSNWEELLFTPAPVDSVNGQTGVVVLGFADVGATPISHVGTGGSQHAQVTTSVDGFMSAADKTKLDGVATGATAGITQLTGDVTATGPGSVAVTLLSTVINSKLLTGFLAAFGIPSATDSILQAIGKLAGTSNLTPRTVSSDTTVPTAHIWVRSNETIFSGLTTVTLQGDSELRFI
jgi:hypothetical protein